MEILPSSTADLGGASSTAGLKLAKDFDSFLSLLTTQLKNQDPLSPVDSTQFTEQLALFTNVEQTINANKNLEQLIALSKASQSASALGYLGTTVEIEGASAELAQGSAVWSYTLPADAASVSVSIRDADGNVVLNVAGPTAAGTNSFVWNGLDSQGVPQPDGFYDIEVLAKDGQGLPLATTTTIQGRVTGVDTGGDEVLLTVNGAKVALDKVIAVRETPPPPASAP